MGCDLSVPVGQNGRASGESFDSPRPRQTQNNDLMQPNQLAGRPSPAIAGLPVRGGQSAENVAKLVDTIYNNSRLYTGGPASEVAKWRAEGMDPQHKTVSSMDRWGEHLRRTGTSDFTEEEIDGWQNTAHSHYYFAENKQLIYDPRRGKRYPGASAYAVMSASHENPPKISRSFLTSRARVEQIERDPDTANHAWRTKAGRKVDVGYVLQSSSSPVSVTAASEALRDEFNGNSELRQRLNVDVTLTSDEAAKMLRERQTPSPQDDFPMLEGPLAAIDYRRS